ncbi:hypothetical protein ACQP2U_23855 [Nocardia sp. CA-084685]|uniref:hypothetical protein n=1 Tax=Nocardia sp. CA-084685 TaxID=3239970 RepID=UPI003D96830B
MVDLKSVEISIAFDLRHHMDGRTGLISDCHNTVPAVLIREENGPAVEVVMIDYGIPGAARTIVRGRGRGT